MSGRYSGRNRILLNTLPGQQPLGHWTGASVSGVADGSTIPTAAWRDTSRYNAFCTVGNSAAVYRATQGPNGGSCVECNTLNQNYSMGNSLQVNSQHLTVAYVLKTAVWGGTGFVPFKAGGNGYGISPYYSSQGMVSNSQFSPGNVGGADAVVIPYGTGNFGWNIWIYVYSPTGIRFRRGMNLTYPLGSDTFVAESLQSYRPAGGYIAQFPSNSFFGQYAEIIAYPYSAHDGQIASIEAQLANKYNLFTASNWGFAQSNRIVFSGNSIHYGYGCNVSFNQSTAYRTFASLGAGWDFVNCAWPGQNDTQMITRDTTRVDPLFATPASGFNILVSCCEQTNWFAQAGSSSGAITNMATYGAARRAATPGIKIVGMTCLKAATITGGNETSRAAFNSALLALCTNVSGRLYSVNSPSATGCDYVVDQASNAQLDYTVNPGNFVDNIHPNEAGAVYQSADWELGVNAII